MTRPTKFSWDEHGGALAFSLTVAVALAPPFLGGRIAVNSTPGLGLLACAFVYLLLGLFAPEKCGPHPCRTRLFVAYVVAQFSLLTAIFWLTRFNGMAVLAALPLVCQLVANFSPRPAALWVAALYGIILAIGFRLGGGKDLVMFGGSVLAGFAFVIVFTRIAVKANEARDRAEKLSAQLTEANLRLREQAARIEELAMARERNRLAREIHDSLGHALTTIAVQLEAARAVHAANPARALDAIAKAHALSQEALVDVRRSVSSLRVETVERPLPERLRELAALDSDPLATFSLQGAPRPLTPEAAHALFRVAQEGLTNVRKHAAAKNVVLALDYRDAVRVSVTVTDDGRGAPTAGTTAGYGLTGLRERVALLGGSLVAVSAANANAAAPAPVRAPAPARTPETTGGFVLRAEVPA